MDLKSGEKRFAKGVAASQAAGKFRAGATSNTTSSPMQTTDHALQEDPGRVAAGIQHNRQWVQEQEGFPREKFEWMTNSLAGKVFEADCYRRVSRTWCELGGNVMELCSWQGMYHKDCPCRFCVFNRYHHQHEVSSHCNEEAVKFSKSAKRRFRRKMYQVDLGSFLH